MTHFNKVPIKILRGIVQELRTANPKLKPISETPVFSYIINEYKRHQITERRTCKSPNELHSLAKTYLCYLQSLREHQELLKQYYSKGEHSVDKTAQILGFSLPNNPKEKPTND